MQDSSLEKQMQQLMSGLEFEPDAAVWENVEREIHKKEKKRVAAWWWLTGILLLGLSGGILWHSFSSRSATPVAAKTDKPAETVPATGAVAPAAPQAGTSTAQEAGATPGPSEAVNGNIAAPEAAVAGTTPAAAETEAAGAAASSASATGGNRALMVTARHKQRSETTATEKHGTKRAVKNSREAQVNNRYPFARLQEGTALQQSAALPQQTDMEPAPVENAAPPQTDASNGTAPWQFPAVDASIAFYDKKGQSDITVAGNNLFTPAVAKPAITTAAVRNTDWKVYPVIAAGAAANVGGLNTTYSYGSSSANYAADFIVQPDKAMIQDRFNSSNPGTGTGGGQGQGQFNYYKTERFTYARPAFRAGVELEKDIANRWKLLTGLQYQFVSYKSVIISELTGSFSSAITTHASYDYSYRLHYLAVPLQMQYCFSQKSGISAGIINSIALAGTQRGESIKMSMRTWVPSAMLSVDLKWKAGNKGNYWKISPFMQYGLRNSIKGSLSDKRMLQGGIQAVWQINNK